MAIALAVNPAMGTGSGPITSPSFSPGAGSLLVAVLTAGGFGAVTVSNSGTARTWTRRVVHPTDDFLAIYTAENATALSNITVSASSSGAIGGGLKVYVITGQHPTAYIGQTGNGTSSTNNVTPTVYTSSAAASRGIGAATDYNGLGAPSSTDDETTVQISDIGAWAMSLIKAANTATSGEAVTFNLDASGTGTPSWKWVALEILPASLDATIDAVTVDAVASIPSPSLSTGSTVSPSTVTATADIPTPSISAGATASPATVTATAVIPTPSVTAGSTELVEPSTVTATADIPTPTITAVQNATVSPATVDAVADIPAPDVSATFSATVSPDTVDAVAVIPSPGVSVPVLPGQFITQDGQVEWNSVVWGPGTSYRVRDISGWEARPQVDDLTVEEPARHGAFAGSSLIQRRIVQIRLQVDSISDPTQLSGLLRQLRYDTRTLRDNTLWPLVIRGYTETLLAYGKCIDRTGVMDSDWSVGAPEPVITIMCPDPRRYSLEQHSQVILANESTPTTLANDGQLYTNPILRFSGPATNPLIINETLDRILAFDLTLSAGQILVVDTQLGTVKIGSDDFTAFISDTISVPIKEFFLDVGSSQLSYETDAGGTAGVEVLWRDAHE